MTVRTMAFLGDSLTLGDQGGFSYALGGQGCWSERVVDLLANTAGIGPLISSGFRGVQLGFPASGYPAEWLTQPASLTTVVSTDAFDRYPYTAGRYANGAAQIWTWTKPARYRSIVGFALYWVNKTGGGNWQYRIDGGTWTNMGQTLGGATANKLCKFYVATAITSTLDIRASSDASTAVDCFPAGIEVYYLDPLTTTQGIIGHNISVNASKLHEICLATSGDRLAFLDSIQLGTGSPIASTPNAGTIVMHINDVQLASQSGWATDLTTLNTRASPLGPVGIISPYECSTAAYNQTQQTNYRAQTKTTAASLSAKTTDLFDAWNANGWGTNALANTAGLLFDLTHESQLGHVDLTTRIYWFIRNQILALGAVPTSYPVAAKKAAVQYSGKQAAVQYSAGAPVSIA